MTVSETLLLALLAGCALGALFFGGLWWTVRRMIRAPSPAVWVLGSLLLRAAIAVSGFYLVGQGDWRRLVACLIGFMAARVIVQRWAAPLTARAQRRLQSTGDAH